MGALSSMGFRGYNQAKLWQQNLGYGLRMLVKGPGFNKE
jgi:hypothetical protein